ncbi:MAG: DNA polymerase IV [Candidatus Omnitrophica bacterium]|nr:DNA polymerase IV [Candidatus Omnitrophota bacterium]
MSRHIVHIDMDAFFAAIEQRDRSELRGKPVVVGADPLGGRGRGVVSTCSYEARKYGIHSAMPISRAYQLCPGAEFQPVRMGRYARESARILRILEQFTPLIEKVSIDEAFLDISGSAHLFGGPQNACRRMKRVIFEETELTASIGLASSKLLAKIASDYRKPDGFTCIAEAGQLRFLWRLPIGKLWGVGKKTEEVLHVMGIQSIGQIARADPALLNRELGRAGTHLYQLAWGIDPRGIETGTEPKSISRELTYSRDVLKDECRETDLLRLCEDVVARLRAQHYKGKTVSLKIRLEGFRTYTRTCTMNASTNFVDTVYAAVRRLYRGFDAGGRKIRLLGVRLSEFVPEEEKDFLFHGCREERQEQMHRAVEQIRARYGSGAIQRARLLSRENSEL